MIPKICVVCGNSYTPRSWSSGAVPQCSAACKKIHRERRAKVVVAKCLMCSAPVEVRGRYPLKRLWRGYAYCSPECQKAWKRHSAREAVKPHHRRMHSIRMKLKNPMRLAAVRKAVSATHKARGHKPPVRGGNGCGPTVPEKKLARALGWRCHGIVCTHATKGSGYPNHYKLDVFSKKYQIAIEIDGKSHNVLARQAQDKKKAALLESLGWIVLRFKNRQVLEELSECVKVVRDAVKKSDWCKRNPKSGPCRCRS